MRLPEKLFTEFTSRQALQGIHFSGTALLGTGWGRVGIGSYMGAVPPATKVAQKFPYVLLHWGDSIGLKW